MRIGLRPYRVMQMALLAALFLLGTAQAASPAAIASAHPLATEAGVEVLNAGGNAFDAAVAVGAALAVVEPYGSGIGGGGFWLLHRASDGKQIFLDGRETAPSSAHADMYLDENGEVDREASLVGARAAAIPGTPAALAHLAEHYGTLPLSRSLAPAIRLAREGFPVNEHYRRVAGWRLDMLREFATSSETFLVDDEVPDEGHILRQPELANTLERIAELGAAGFYEGEIAQRLVAGVRAAGGDWTLEDLSDYAVIEREPLIAEHDGVRIVTAPPPSAGGIGLLGMLNILAAYDLQALPDATRTHLLVEAMRRIYRDRAEHLGDPDFVDIPIERLISRDYAEGLRSNLRLDRATASDDLRPAGTGQSGGESTTHFSIVDADGNRVAATLTINYPFGSGLTVSGTGVLLNNEMDDFSTQPGVPNAYGLVGSEANAIAAGKRPLSSMTPTFVETDHGVAVLGTPGGSRIITMVLLGTLEFLAGKDPEAWVSRPRFHHQYLPDEIQHEPDAFDDDLARSLRERGHTLSELGREYGNMQAIFWSEQGAQAASDPRGGGNAIVLTPAR